MSSGTPASSGARAKGSERRTRPFEHALFAGEEGEQRRLERAMGELPGAAQIIEEGVLHLPGGEEGNHGRLSSAGLMQTLLTLVTITAQWPPMRTPFRCGP